MNDKIYLMINVALCPFKDLEFYNSDIMMKIIENTNSCKDNKKLADIKKDRDEFMDKIHKNLLLKCNPTSLDEINLLLQKYYPFLFNKILNQNDIEKAVYKRFFYILESFTKALLSHRDGEIVYKYWKNTNDDEFLGPYKELDKVHIFNAISRFIPIDILVATYYSINKIDNPIQLNGFYQHINLVDASLHQLLTEGVAENHVHATSAFNFTTLWYLAMNNRIKDKYFNNFKINQYALSNKISEYILTAQVLRIILAKFLYDNVDLSIYQWINQTIKINYRNRIIYGILNYKENKFLDEIELKEILDELKKDFNIDDGDRENDIIFSIFKNNSNVKTYGENILLHYAFNYKNKHDKLETNNYTYFCDIFFRYISIKNEFYQQVTQSSTIKGLDFFKHYFDRATDGFDKKGKNYYMYMMRTLFQNNYLKKIELRLGILDKENDNRKNIKKILNAYKTILEEDYEIKNNLNVDFPRIGIVYHLIKQPDSIDKCWCIYDENNNFLNDKMYYKKIQNKYLKLIKSILNLRSKIPYLANFIVGIDAASLENNTPIEVFAPVFEEARNSDFDPILIKNKKGIYVKNQSLFFTFHAGEEFRHVISGLRRIDEVIKYCKFHSGDRIGHAIALGINIEIWVKKNPVIIIPRGEYLDNLLWIWGVYSKNPNSNFKAHIYLEEKIYSVSKDIFKNTNCLTPSILYDAYTKRFNILNINDNYKYNEESCKYENYIQKFCPNASNDYAFYWDSEKLQYAYHCKCYLDKLTEPIYINTDEIEKEMAIEMQKYLLNKVAMNGIVIESNPTSNFTIGNIDSIYDNQIFSINSINDDEFKNVLININSDNPMVFNTNVSNEIAYLYYGMLERGIGKEATLKWIEKLRKSGMDTSFIRWNVSNTEYINALYSVIDALDNPNYC